MIRLEDHERIHEYHRSGTFYEVHPDGTKVTKIIGEDYEVVHKNKKVRVRGNVELYVDGNTNLYVRGSLNGQVDEDMSFNVGRNITFHATRTFACTQMNLQKLLLNKTSPQLQFKI